MSVILQGKKNSNRAVSLTNDVTTSILMNKVPNEEPTVVITNGISAVLTRQTPETIGEMRFGGVAQSDGSYVQMPTTQNIFDKKTTKHVDMKVSH